ncbi:MAG: hypothetical protein MUO85_05090 [candidate division Zixibacteria bacterium]|nr:hypothetical protein [candidate division Zixibacteria bacterium]
MSKKEATKSYKKTFSPNEVKKGGYKLREKMMTEMNEKASELDPETRERIQSTLIAQRDQAFDKLIEMDSKFTQYNFLVNAGGAVATLAFIGSEKGTYLAMLPLICFVIGLVATGVQIRALLSFFSILREDASRRSLGFATGKLSVRESLPSQDIGKWTGKLNRWGGWVSQGAFIVGVIVGAIIVGILG